MAPFFFFILGQNLSHFCKFSLLSNLGSCFNVRDLYILRVYKEREHCKNQFLTLTALNRAIIRMRIFFLSRKWLQGWVVGIRSIVC